MDYRSSQIDWCEKNYEWSPYIVEFYNTISNIPYVLFYYVGMYSCKNFQCNQDDRILYGCLFLIGITSMYFHATLSLYGQLLDEFCIILLLMNTLNMIYKKKNTKFYIKCYTITHSIVMCYYPLINIPVLFIIGFTIWKLLRTRFKKYKDTSFKKFWIFSQILFVLSVMCWVIDRFMCGYVQNIQFHALWHILSAWCAYYSILVGVFLEHNTGNYYIKNNLLPIIQKY